MLQKCSNQHCSIEIEFEEEVAGKCDFILENN
jgi:hypothetical protein